MIAGFLAIGSGEKRSGKAKRASSSGGLTVRSAAGSTKPGSGCEAVSPVGSSDGDCGVFGSGACDGAGSGT
jgi:hypothetical protein